jgi:hypothetical protein
MPSRSDLYGEWREGEPLPSRVAAKYERYFDIARTLLGDQEQRLGYERNKDAMAYAMEVHGVGVNTVRTAITHSSACWFPSSATIRWK